MTPEGKGVTLQCWRLLEQGGGDVRGIAGGIVKNEVENFGLPWEDVQCRKKWRRRSKGQLDYPGLCARMAIEPMYVHVRVCARMRAMSTAKQTFLLCDAMRKRGLCCHPVSVHLSMSRWCIVSRVQTAEDIVKLLSRPSIPIILVFCPQFQTELLE